MQLMDKISFRAAEIGDTELLAKMVLDASGGIFQKLLGDLLPGTPPEVLLGMAVTDETSAMGYSNFFVAEIGDEIAGAICAYDSRLFGVPVTLASFLPPPRLHAFGDFFSTSLPAGFYIQTVFVEEGMRGRGIGRVLLETANAVADGLGFQSLLLHVWEDNTPALKLYETFGFSPASRIEIPGCLRMGHSCGKLLLHRQIA